MGYDKKKISIIIPVYNVLPYLEKCVRSVIIQTYKNMEVILIDDGSTDGSGQLCDSLNETDDRIKVVHKENGGLSSARNAGLDVAEGQYIGFVDSDDYIASEMYETLVVKLEKYNADISICNRWYETEDKKRFLRYKETRQDKVMNSEQAIHEMNCFKSFDMAAWDKLYKRELFDKIRFPEGRLSEDFFVMYRLFDMAEIICYTPKPLYHYIQRKGSISRNKKINFDFAEAAYEQMRYIEEKYPDLKACVHCAYASANMTVYNFHIKNQVKCSFDVRCSLQAEVRKNCDYMIQNKDMSIVKKMQTFLFAFSLPIYEFIFRLYKIIDRV